MIQSNTSVNTPFRYASDINISFSCKGHPFTLNMKNKGEKYLFDTISKALCGYDISNDLPKTFDVVQNNGLSESTCLRRQINFTSIVYGDAVSEDRGNKGIVSLSTVLTYEDKQSINHLNEPKLVLKSKSGETLCTIGDEYASQIQTMWSLVTKDTDALIEWRLIFDNGD